MHAYATSQKKPDGKRPSSRQTPPLTCTTMRDQTFRQGVSKNMSDFDLEITLFLDIFEIIIFTGAALGRTFVARIKIIAPPLGLGG